MAEHRLGRQNRRRDHYGRFPREEFDHRYAAVREMMHERKLDALVMSGNSGSLVTYLTNYHPSAAAYFVVFADPSESTLLLVRLSNHLQYAREVSEADEVDIVLPNPPSKVARRIAGTEAADGRIGIVGGDPRYNLSVPHEHFDVLDTGLDADFVDATVPFIKLAAAKSELELDRIRKAAELTDVGMETLAETAAPGVRETELRDALERKYLDVGGGLGMAFITSAPMEDAEPGEALPWHRPSRRKIEPGDVITTEMSAAYRGYRSQIHRAFAVGRSPTPEYETIWSLAKETYESMLDALKPGATAAAVHEAMAPVEESPYKIYDVMLHGYGNGYWHPFIGTAGSNYWPGGDDPVTEEWTFEEGMVVVVQPNVVSPDERQGLQLGSAVVIQDGGPEVLQEYPLGFGRV